MEIPYRMIVETGQNGKHSSVELMFNSVDKILDYLKDCADIWSSHWPQDEYESVFEVPTEESLNEWFAKKTGNQLVVMMGEATDGFEFEIRVWRI